MSADRMDAPPAGVSHLVDRLIGVSNLESSKVAASRAAASRELNSDARSCLDETTRGV